MVRAGVRRADADPQPDLIGSQGRIIADKRDMPYKGMSLLSFLLLFFRPQLPQGEHEADACRDGEGGLERLHAVGARQSEIAAHCAAHRVIERAARRERHDPRHDEERGRALEDPRQRLGIQDRKCRGEEV